MARRRQSDVRRQLGPRLKALRKGIHWRVQDVAEHTGLSVAAISRYENGKRVPSILDAAAIAEAYGVPLDELVSPAPPTRRGAHSPPGLRPDWWPPATLAEARRRAAEADEVLGQAHRDSGGTLTMASQQARRHANTTRAWAVLGLLRVDKRPLADCTHPDHGLVTTVITLALDTNSRWFFEQLGTVLPVGVGPHGGQAAALKTSRRLERLTRKQRRKADQDLKAPAAKIVQAALRRRKYADRPELDTRSKVNAAKAEERTIRRAQSDLRRVLRAGSRPVGGAAERD
jgi:transcriptional regulator with XRE-family HTH domain